MKILVEKLKQNEVLTISKNTIDFAFMSEDDLSLLKLNFEIKYISGNIVIVTGEIITKITKACNRCLETFDQEQTIPFQRKYKIEPTQKELDLSDDIKEEYWLNIPLKYVCKNECKGLCITCGTNLNLAPCSCENFTFQALKNIKNIKKEVD